MTEVEGKEDYLTGLPIILLRIRIHISFFAPPPAV